MRKKLAMLRSSARGLCWFAAAMLVAVAGSAILSPAAAQQVVVMVNGTPITTYDIDQRTKFDQLSLHKTLSRQEVINELVDEKLKVHEAGLYSMSATNAEVDAAVDSMAQRAGLSLKQFTEFLAGHGIGLSTIKSRYRADIAWTQLVRARFPATLQIEDSEIRAALEKKGEGNAVAYDYSLRPILFIVAKGAPSSVVQGRVREAEGLRTRFDGCKDGIALARTLRDVAVRDPVQRTSADLPNALRDVLNSTPIGKLTKPEVIEQGVQVFALCSRTENKSDTPEKRNIRQQLFDSRFEAQSKRYLDEVRRSAMIEYK